MFILDLSLADSFLSIIQSSSQMSLPARGPPLPLALNLPLPHDSSSPDPNQLIFLSATCDYLKLSYSLIYLSLTCLLWNKPQELCLFSIVSLAPCLALCSLLSRAWHKPSCSLGLSLVLSEHWLFLHCPWEMSLSATCHTGTVCRLHCNPRPVVLLMVCEAHGFLSVFSTRW